MTNTRKLTDVATPGGSQSPAGFADVTLPEGLGPAELADLLYALPEDILDITRQQVTTTVDGATAVYIDDETAAQPKFGMIVTLIVEPAADAGAVVANLQITRWGDPAGHTVTGSGAGDTKTPAYREFWRIFPPGLFAIPNQPVYFLIWYRALDPYAFMLIGASPMLRQALADALVSTLRTGISEATPTP